MFSVNGRPVVVERFPDKTPRLNIKVEDRSVILEWIYEEDEEMLLYFITRHLRERFGVNELILRMPYLPHARMDRVKHQDEVFTLKYFCDFINDLHFDRVLVRDAHSNVSLGLLNNVIAEPIAENIIGLIGRLLDKKSDIVFYPDEGSCKRYSEMISFPCAFGLKERDWQTGQILNLSVQGVIPPKPFKVLIIDDISSYGGTFLHAARKLKELGATQIYLYVTHCEHSILSGELIDSGLLEKIYTTESIFTADHRMIEVIGGSGNEKN
ncbi:MAG: ribose-phosphate pyrophosphokinase [Lachnospiraceae bacterium]|jgi:ribose-phosphate pyrophosphokinase|nr:ribose-phosphate pyrophosphokinase [Lachnospiraceae bacterium]